MTQWAQPAFAHLEIRPSLVAQGIVTDVRVELPQLRPGPPPDRLEVEGNGIEVMSVALQGTPGSDTVWNVRLRATAAPGVVPIVLRAVYADGASVAVDQQLTVAPGPEQSGFPWIAVAAGTLLAVALAVLSLRLARRKA